MQSEVITRRNLPHWYVPGAMHFVTYRLAGTIPASVLHNLRQQRTAHLAEKRPTTVTVREHRDNAHKRFFAAYDRYLDETQSITWLATPQIAALIRGNLYHHRGSRYYLLAYCVMPNHVHVLFQPQDLALLDGTNLGATRDEPDERPDAGSPLAEIMHSLKSYTAHEANQFLRRSGPFWQRESYDHWVRDDDELERIVQYIIWNPVKAKLANKPHEWWFSSAHDRFLQDGSEGGFLLEPG
jgi:REP-associated tyrosine transposase